MNKCFPLNQGRIIKFKWGSELKNLSQGVLDFSKNVVFLQNWAILEKRCPDTVLGPVLESSLIRHFPKL